MSAKNPNNNFESAKELFPELSDMVRTETHNRFKNSHTLKTQKTNDSLKEISNG